MNAEEIAEQGGRFVLVGLLKERGVDTALACSGLQQGLVIHLDAQFLRQSLGNLLSATAKLAANCNYKLFHIRWYLSFRVSTP